MKWIAFLLNIDEHKQPLTSHLVYSVLALPDSVTSLLKLITAQVIARKVTSTLITHICKSISGGSRSRSGIKELISQKMCDTKVQEHAEHLHAL